MMLNIFAIFLNKMQLYYIIYKSYKCWPRKSKPNVAHFEIRNFNYHKHFYRYFSLCNNKFFSLCHIFAQNIMSYSLREIYIKRLIIFEFHTLKGGRSEHVQFYYFKSFQRRIFLWNLFAES